MEAKASIAPSVFKNAFIGRLIVRFKERDSHIQLLSYDKELAKLWDEVLSASEVDSSPKVVNKSPRILSCQDLKKMQKHRKKIGSPRFKNDKLPQVTTSADNIDEVIDHAIQQKMNNNNEAVKDESSFEKENDVFFGQMQSVRT